MRRSGAGPTGEELVLTGTDLIIIFLLLSTVSTMIQEEHLPRKIPNILVTGTPGTGKSSLSQLLN